MLLCQRQDVERRSRIAIWSKASAGKINSLSQWLRILLASMTYERIYHMPSTQKGNYFDPMIHPYVHIYVAGDHWQHWQPSTDH